MPAMVIAEEDDLRHLPAADFRHRRAGRPADLTLCGRHAIPGVDPHPDTEACHVCLPDEAHPLAGVWEQCRRWDEEANAWMDR